MGSNWVIAMVGGVHRVRCLCFQTVRAVCIVSVRPTSQGLPESADGYSPRVAIRLASPSTREIPIVNIGARSCKRGWLSGSRKASTNRCPPSGYIVDRRRFHTNATQKLSVRAATVRQNSGYRIIATA
jgi:hypothetical protein